MTGGVVRETGRIDLARIEDEDVGLRALVPEPD